MSDRLVQIETSRPRGEGTMDWSGVAAAPRGDRPDLDVPEWDEPAADLAEEARRARPHRRSAPASGSSTRTSMFRAASCGSVERSPTSRMGPQGMPVARQRSMSARAVAVPCTLWLTPIPQ